jgi:uncharacterized protein GlcG (DUF336 family)
MRTIPTLDNSDAIVLRDAALTAAREAGIAVAVAVVDSAGTLLDFHRHQGTRSHMVDFAIRKARTAAQLGLPTKMLEAMAAQGRPMSPETLAMAGGVPVIVDGLSAGAVGVSGGSSEADHNIAGAAVAALDSGDG